MNNLILIVDDVMLNIEILTAILHGEYKIVSALSGKEAIAAMEQYNPDLVLLDVFMPDMDGFAVLEYMKKSEKLTHIPVIFVTGEHDSQSEEKGLKLGAVDYIKKPFNEAVVEVKVRNHLDLKLYRDNLELMVSQRTRQLEASRDAVIMGMSFMSDFHDRETGSHIERIKTYTRILITHMMEMYPKKITRSLADQIILYAPLHDVGKIGISDSILKKRGKLSSAEFEKMKRHTVEGAVLLRKTGRFLLRHEDVLSMRIAVEIAHCHHEKYDGSGYPDALKGDKIPLSARIVSLADIYDALRSPRPYKEPMTHETAVDIILSGDGRTRPSHFDPAILRIFRDMHNEFKKAYSEEAYSEGAHNEDAYNTEAYSSDVYI